MSDKLLKIRQSLGLSQNGLIAALGLLDLLTQAEISAFEQGKRVPPLIVLLHYARAFKVHVDDLIDDEIDLGPVKT
ncbi:MAG: helix-turn-helix transcriptional regulator [Pyrinomonadaceae bacterium]|nr:helix-turn-helix transcriptional regulator [Chloracidobacterium sp.]HRI04944.1 helix-turn-helix transcriptional regulator [Pyrinomonadaceae bacterium]